MKTRELTVQPLVNPGFSYKKQTIYSKLRLKGKRLTEMGFILGEKVVVLVEKNRLTIERREK